MGHAQFFIKLCDCNRVNCTNYRRGSNLAFFKLYTNMVGKNVQKCVHSLLLQFPEKNDLPEWNLTVSNHQRCQINKRINNELHKEKGGVWVDASHQMECQGFWLFPGLHIVGCSTDNGIFNGQLYTVLGIENDKITLSIYGTDDEIILCMCHIKVIKPAHAITFYSCQGRTLRGRVRLYIQHPKITTTHLIVGLSRAVCPSLIDCV